MKENEEVSKEDILDPEKNPLMAKIREAEKIPLPDSTPVVINIDMHLGTNSTNLVYDVRKDEFNNNVPQEIVFKFLKGIYSNTERFKGRFLARIKAIGEKLDAMDEIEKAHFVHFDKIREIYTSIPESQFQHLIDRFDAAEPLTYKEAFEIEDASFKMMAFAAIDIEEMIEECGHVRIKADGKRVNHKQYDKEGNFIGMKEYDVLYETHKVYGEKLGTDDSFALKASCTTTGKTHWLWIEDKYKDSPLDAVASLVRVHKNLIPYIKEIKRQGDILLIEMTPEAKDIKPEGDTVPLTAEQYFSLLTAQS